jgi:N-acetylmuramoyl-L-alanine amidase
MDDDFSVEDEVVENEAAEEEGAEEEGAEEEVVDAEAEEGLEETAFEEAPLPSEVDDAEPAGNGPYVVQQGESISSIACAQGLFWETIWWDPVNSALREARGNPDVLLPGDRLTIPEIEIKHVPAATDMRHRYVRRGVPAMLRLRLVDAAGEPRAGVPYTLDAGGMTFSGESDPDGWIKHPVPPDARTGKLRFNDGLEEYDLSLGEVDPIESITGIQARLHNLGYDCGMVDGICGPLTSSALTEFQEANGLPPSGEPDKATKEKLLAAHGG